MSDTDRVLHDLTDGIATITLNRPERKNAWTVGMQAGYFGALSRLAANPEIRVIVLTGAGGAFCPGADTQALTVYTETDSTRRTS